ncbi:MAG: hypothetical protein ACYCW6_01435, partial [Candidatus Xenobia bacterium]
MAGTVVRGRLLILLLWLALPAHADTLSVQVMPGGAVLQTTGGQTLAQAAPGRVGTLTFVADGATRYCIRRPPFDALDLTVWKDGDGRWRFATRDQAGRLDPFVVLALSRTLQLNVHPGGVQVYVLAEAAHAGQGASPQQVVSIAGLPHNVVPLEQHGAIVRIPHAWSPPALYLVRLGFAPRIVPIGEGALDTPVALWPAAPISLSPRYGPFSYPAFDEATAGLATMLLLGWGLWLAPLRRARQRQERLWHAVAQDVQRSRQERSKAHLLTERTLAADSGARYLLLDLLGEGGMGAVYEAVMVGEGRTERVAVKVLLEPGWDEPGVRERFRREARICETLVHSAVVKVLDSGLWQDASGGLLPFTVMERISG